MEENKVRKAIVDGIFYPIQPDELNSEIGQLLSLSSIPVGCAAGIMVPHAGYKYTGPMSADAFKSCMNRKVSTAVIIAPVTRDAHDGIFLSDYSSFQTPLGTVPVNIEAVQTLLAYKGRFKQDNFPFMEEHSIEVQLPFLQTLFPKASIVPIHLGKQNTGTIKQLARGLSKLFSDKKDSTLFVVSGNISPYLSRNLAQKYADNFINLIKNGDCDAILEELQVQNTLPNSTGCAATVLSVLGKNTKVSVLTKEDSGGDKIVCYASLSFSSEQ